MSAKFAQTVCTVLPSHVLVEESKKYFQVGIQVMQPIFPLMSWMNRCHFWFPDSSNSASSLTSLQTFFSVFQLSKDFIWYFNICSEKKLFLILCIWDSLRVIQAEDSALHGSIMKNKNETKTSTWSAQMLSNFPLIRLFLLTLFCIKIILC